MSQIAYQNLTLIAICQNQLRAGYIRILRCPYALFYNQESAVIEREKAHGRLRHRAGL